MNLLENWPKANLTPNSRVILDKRYLIKDQNGNPIETPEDMIYRVAYSNAVEEVKYGKSEEEVQDLTRQLYVLMVNMWFLPNSPTLMNAGRDLGQLSACFVLPIEDNMGGIFDAIKDAALIHKSGGGTGFSFSRLRSKNSAVRSTGGVASGPVSFMKVFNSATEAVKQGGTRRGANLALLRVDHPDILEFISCKADNNEINNFNISVGITEEFMEAMRANSQYDLVDPHTGKVSGQLSARDVFTKIVDRAWQNGEPGIIFLDRINQENPTPHIGEIETCNPCGETPLLPNEACNLGSINLKPMVKEENGKTVIDWILLQKTTRLAIRFLDNVIDANQYPLPVIEEVVKGNRKVGLGVMGFADMLILLKIPYNSEEAVQYAQIIMSFIREEARKESERLAEERGVFPNFEGSVFDGYLQQRNATLTTIAPTGTISMICGVSGGIEPIFAVAYTKTVMDGTSFVEVNPLFEMYAQKYGFYSQELMQKVAKQGTVKGLKEVPEWIQKIFVTAHEIAPEWHIKVQAAFQKYTDNAVSKTINFPFSATREDVAKAYLMAYDLGCKGLTVYRDGSREEQVYTKGTSPQAKTQSLIPRPRPEVTAGVTEKIKIGCGNLYVSVNSDDQGICEIFTNTGRAGGCSSQSEATARLISLALRSGISEEAITEQIWGIRCPACMRRDGVNVMSCPDAIARVIKKYGTNVSLKTGKKKPVMKNSKVNAENVCPECGTPFNHESGCLVCVNCGFSKCM